MVTAAEVWDALAEIPDPEIPVISLVDLGVIKDVDVQDGRVTIDFTPTFMGCPALEHMQRAMEAKVAELGGDGRRSRGPRRFVVVGQHHPRGPREAPRGGLCAARAAPGREASSSSQLQRGFRCPYCDSTETRLENLFGPTPCRSIRYCDACRQPFEQFKTL